MLTMQEIRQLDTKALQDEIASAQKEFFKISFQAKSGLTKEIHLVKKWKKYVARLKTFEKEAGKEIKEVKKEAVEKAPKKEKKVVKKETSKKAKTPVKKSAKKITKK